MTNLNLHLKLIQLVVLTISNLFPLEAKQKSRRY